MTLPDRASAGPPEPGDRAPAGRLTRPPSDRYRSPADTNPPEQPGQPAGPRRSAQSAPSPLRALAPAIVAGLVTAAILTVVGGVLAERRGLLAIAGIGGAVIGLLAARAAVSPDGSAAPVMTRSRVTRLAVAIALASTAVSALATWAYGRLEGGVMDPIAYLWETFGLFVPGQAVVAAVAAAWGAGAGPVRGRS